MRQFGRAVSPRVLMTRLVLAGLVAVPAAVVAAPGDTAANQNKYPAIRGGARNLHRAIEALEKGDDKFKGHRVAAIRLIREALTELDEAVGFADRNGKAGEKGMPHFDADRGKLAASQSKYMAIRGGANRVIDAGKALDQGLDKFGGHRVKALKTLNSALDELEKAVKSAP